MKVQGKLYSTNDFDGCDDDVVVYFAPDSFQEVEITRARRYLILVTMDPEILKALSDATDVSLMVSKAL